MGDMIYITVIVCVVVVCLTVVAIAFREEATDGTLSEVLDKLKEYKELEKETLLEAIKSVAWGPQNQPTMDEFMAQVRKEYEELETATDETGFPLHEVDDELLRWVPNEPEMMTLLDLPEHEENDGFMNEPSQGDFV